MADDFGMNIYEPVGSLFEPAILKLLLDFCTKEEIVECINSVQDQDTEKMQRKKLLFNIALDRYGFDYEKFKI